MKLLHVDASARYEWSSSRMLSRHFVARVKELTPSLEVTYLDVAKNPPSHVSEMFTRATYTPESERTPEMREALRESDDLCAMVLSADAIVIATPMYNFSMPSTLKAFLDNIVRTGVTYNLLPEGGYAGKLVGKPALFITARGADFASGSPIENWDALTPALKAGFGFIGLTAPNFVDAHPLQFSDQKAKEDALVQAKLKLDGLACEWSSVLL